MTATVNQEWKYQTENLLIEPYRDTLNGTAYPEEFLARLYGKANGERTLHWLFPTMQPMTLNRFIAYFHDRDIVLVLTKRAEQWQVAGWGWLFEISGHDGARRASAGYVFYREFWGTEEIRELCRMAMRYWFAECRVDAIFGATLVNNLRSQHFNDEIGMKVLGVVPKWLPTPQGLKDAVVTYATKEEYMREVR